MTAPRAWTSVRYLRSGCRATSFCELREAATELHASGCRAVISGIWLRSAWEVLTVEEARCICHEPVSPATATLTMGIRFQTTYGTR